MRFLIFNGVVIAALFYLFNADQADLRNAADTAHSMIDKAGSAATQVVAKTRDFVNRDEPEQIEKIEPEPQPPVDTVEAAPPPPPAEPVVEKVEAAEAAPPPPPPAPEQIAEAPRRLDPPLPPVAPEQVAETPKRLDPPHPISAPAPEPVTAKKPTLVAAAEVPEELPEQFVPARPTPTVDYKAAEGRLPTKDPAVAKRQAEVLAGATPAPQAKTAAKSSEYAIAEGETLMTPRQRRKELDHLAEDMEFFFIDKLSR